VLAGEMSLVGPRPRNQFDRSIDLHINHNLMAVKPGVVGPWVRRDHLVSPSLLHDELNYVRKWQIWLDVPILFQAAFSMLRRVFYHGPRKARLASGTAAASVSRRPDANWQEDLLT
jgi:lipopolysaccharide/colanic/teichoic acid biosynthesis glycosyltransferase